MAASSFLEFIRNGYSRASLLALGLLIATGASVGYRFSDLLDTSGGIDWLLLGIWVWMAALLAWQVSAKHDAFLLAVGLVGGSVIEWWGTTSEIWSYFTAERPPLWILPAWPFAALTIDRLASVLGDAVQRLERWLGREPASFRILYWLILPGFVLLMARFVAPSLHHGSSLIVLAVMVAVTLHCPNPRRDVIIFSAGSTLGIFLEYWGTSRECWTYYTEQVPPLAAVLAHGFASVVFTRSAQVLERIVAQLNCRAVTAASPGRLTR